MNFYDLIISPFVEFNFMRYALASIAFLALSAAPVGVFLVMRRMSPVGDALSHAVLPGAVIGYVATGLSLPAMSIGGFAAGMLMALLAGLVSRFTSLKEDANFVALYLGSLAIGVVLVSRNDDSVGLPHLLFGSVLAVDVLVLQLVAAVASLAVTALAVIYRPLMLESIDPLFLRAINDRGGVWHMLFLVLAVMNLVAGFQALGTLMSVGLVMLPAITARLWARNMGGLMLASSAFALVYGPGGLLFSYRAETPSGPAIILWCGVLYLFSVVFGKEGGMLTKWLKYRKHRTAWRLGMYRKSGRRVLIRCRIPYHRNIGLQMAFLRRGRLNASGHIVEEKGNRMLLGVNIDHVAMLHNARGTTYPSPVEAMLVAETHGADLITLHLREDRRHMKGADVLAVKNAIRTRLNLEMALTEEMLENALNVMPEDVCIVPEGRQEITTEGGLGVLAQQDKVAQYVKTLTDAGMRVSPFIGADGGQIQAAYEVGAPVIELHTGAYTDAPNHAERVRRLARIENGAHFATDLGLVVSAGHDLTIHNVMPIAQVPAIRELNIGHSLIVQAIFLGLPEAMHRMKETMFCARMMPQGTV